MAKKQKITGMALGKAIADALGIPHTRRIVLDIGLDYAVEIYVELYGDERLLEIDYDGLGIRITNEDAD